MVARTTLLDPKSRTASRNSHDLDRNVAESSDYVPAGPQALPVDEEERMLPSHSSQQMSEKPKPVSWKSLPRKDQLFILTLARLSEPLTQTSLQAYMFYQLRSFSPSAPDSTISYQAGMLQAAFTGAQFCTAIFWGRMADWEHMGRKRVILIGLLGTAIGALGFGFSSSFAVALLWRFVGGGEPIFLSYRRTREHQVMSRMSVFISESLPALYAREIDQSAASDVHYKRCDTMVNGDFGPIRRRARLPSQIRQPIIGRFQEFVKTASLMRVSFRLKGIERHHDLFVALWFDGSSLPSTDTRTSAQWQHRCDENGTFRPLL